MEGVSFRASTEYLLQNSSVEFTISWERGTDIKYTLYFNDSTDHEWDFISGGHTTNYSQLVTYASHNYSLVENVTIDLIIGNDVGHIHRFLLVNVEPPLSSAIGISTFYTPLHVPTPVSFVIELPSAVSKYYIILWCDFNFGDPLDNVKSVFVELHEIPFNVNHTYVAEMSHTSADVVCYNHVSNTTWSSQLILQENITEMKIVPNMLVGLTHEELLFNLSVVTGSDIVFTVDYGDGSPKTTFTHHNVYSYEEPFIIYHTFNTDETFLLSVYAENMFFNTTTMLWYVLQHKVQGFSLTGPTHVAFPPGEGDYMLYYTENVPNPTEVTCNWTVSDIRQYSVYSNEISNGQDYTYHVIYSRDELGINNTLSVCCYNLASEYNLNISYSMYEVIENITVEFYPRHLERGQWGTLNISLIRGSEVDFSIGYGDGSITNLKHPNPIAYAEPFLVNKTYNTIGNFSISVTAYNHVGQAKTSLTYDIVVQNAIEHLAYHCTNHTVWPPGSVMCEIGVITPQQILHNVHCDWNCGGSVYLYTYVDTLDQFEPYDLHFNTSREHLGNTSVLVNCYNLVSNLSFTMTIAVELDAIILEDLKSNGSVFLTNATSFILTIQRYGSQSCFHWDMGDGIGVFVYRTIECLSHAEEMLLPFQLTFPGQLVLLHNYTYQNYGVHDVSVHAFNHVSNDTLFTTSVVLDWLCFAPNITMPNITTDQSVPYQHKRCEKYTISPSFDIYCWKTHEINITWHIFRLDINGNQASIPTSNQKGIFNITDRELEYGMYDVQISASMGAVSNTTAVAHSYIEIIKCPLFASMTGDMVIQVKENTSYLINAMDVSYDPDVELFDKTGMEFTWICNRTDTSTFDQIFGDKMDKFDGCFNDGFDLTSHRDGKLTLVANNFLPMSWHEIRVVITKDSRSASFGKMVYISPQDPPVMEMG